jgi:hypothetical protein
LPTRVFLLLKEKSFFGSSLTTNLKVKIFHITPSKNKSKPKELQLKLCMCVLLAGRVTLNMSFHLGFSKKNGKRADFNSPLSPLYVTGIYPPFSQDIV